MEQARFATYDEVELAAHLYLPSGREEWGPGIIVCHGFGSRKENFAAFGERGASAGYAVLIMDLRGHGESGGQVDSNIFNDVAAAMLYLQNRPEVNPMSIAIRGSSLGGWLAIHTAAHLRDLTHVVAYCPAHDSGLIILMEEMALVQRGHTSHLVPETPPRVDVNSTMQLLYRLNVRKAARHIHPRPLLLVHCEGDEVVPAHISERIYEDAMEPKTLWLLPGGDHRFAQHDPETDQRMLEWLTHLRRNSRELTSADIPDVVPD